MHAGKREKKKKKKNLIHFFKPSGKDAVQRWEGDGGDRGGRGVLEAGGREGGGGGGGGWRWMEGCEGQRMKEATPRNQAQNQ